MNKEKIGQTGGGVERGVSSPGLFLREDAGVNVRHEVSS